MQAAKIFCLQRDQKMQHEKKRLQSRHFKTTAAVSRCAIHLISLHSEKRNAGEMVLERFYRVKGGGIHLSSQPLLYISLQCAGSLRCLWLPPHRARSSPSLTWRTNNSVCFHTRLLAIKTQPQRSPATYISLQLDEGNNAQACESLRSGTER